MKYCVLVRGETCGRIGDCILVRGEMWEVLCIGEG